MNQKIKTLIKEAGFSTWGDELWAAGEPDDIDWSSDYTQEMEMFIHALVAEAANIAAGSLGGYKQQVYDAVVSELLTPDESDNYPEPTETDEWASFDKDC